MWIVDYAYARPEHGNVAAGYVYALKHRLLSTDEIENDKADRLSPEKIDAILALICTVML